MPFLLRVKGMFSLQPLALPAAAPPQIPRCRSRMQVPLHRCSSFDFVGMKFHIFLRLLVFNALVLGNHLRAEQQQRRGDLEAQ